MGPPKFTSISANADGPRDAVQRKIDHIALHTEFNYQATSVECRLIANCYRHQEMSDIITYLNDNAQTPLGRFVVYTLNNELCNKYGDKSNRWSLCLSLSQL